MTGLSWLIYGAEVVGNLQGLLVFVTIFGCVGVGIASLAAGYNSDCGDGKRGDWKKSLKWLWVPTVAAIVATIIPSQQAVYMIAASQFGEQVVTSPDAIEVMADLKAIIKKRLKNELGDAAK
jgi:H+/Cl- antiporter ClcA